MFQIYLPIAEVPVNILLLLGLGWLIGVISGMFGVGGGFLMTPLLIFIGVPPPVAVGSSINLVVAASASGCLAHWRLGNIDFKMGGLLVAGGAVGSLVGVWIFDLLRSVGQINLVISLSYVAVLTLMGVLMTTEAVRAIIRRGRTGSAKKKMHKHTWIHGLPFKMRFRASRLYISALMPFSISFVAGIMTAVMGVSGGFFLVPAMIYLLGMPVGVVVGTSLFRTLFVAGVTTFLHSLGTHTIDIVLAGLLTVGAVIGAQFGTRFGAGLRGEELRGLLALLVLGVAAWLLYNLVTVPTNLFSLAVLGAS